MITYTNWILANITRQAKQTHDIFQHLVTFIKVGGGGGGGGGGVILSICYSGFHYTKILL